MSKDFEPIACSLPLREAAKQAGEWHDLSGRALLIEEIDGGLSVVYPSHMTSEVEDLVAREAACCAWLSIETSPTEEGIRIDVTSSNPDARPVIEALIGN